MYRIAHSSFYYYFTISTTQVIRQFGQMRDDPDCGAEECYVLGHRLVHFLSNALPQHPSYSSAAVLSQRQRVVTETLTIRAALREIAVQIDEEQLNRYMAHDYDPLLEDDDDDDESESENDERLDGAAASASAWERFDGWSFDVPGMADTDESSQDVDEDGYYLAAVAQLSRSSQATTASGQ